MDLKTVKNGFLGSDQGVSFQAPYKEARAVVIPFGMESTVSYGGGTSGGPQAIIKASHQVETLDEQCLLPFFSCGVATLKEPAMPNRPEAALALLSKTVAKVSNDGKFPVVLGGEHSITQGVIAGLQTNHEQLTVLHFDAHSDTRTEYHGSPYSHAAVMSQVLENFPVPKLVQVGIRNVTDQNGELEFRQRQKKRIKTFWGWENPSPRDIVESIPTGNVFISFDVDAFDPSIMPSTGTPEPGGLLWWPTLEILKAVFKSKNVVGADVVELAPVKGIHAPDFLVAKLVYKLIGYKHFKV